MAYLEQNIPVNNRLRSLRCNRCKRHVYAATVQAYGFTSVSTYDTDTFVGRLLQLGEFGLVKLVYSAGVDVSWHHYHQLAMSSADTHDQLYSSTLNFIGRLLHNPRRLKDLCRQQIRRLLASNVLRLVSQLDVGDCVKDYLCIMDTDHYTDV